MKKAIVLLVVVGLLGGCSAHNSPNKTVVGTVAGTAVGAGLGAIIGSQTGHAGPGIAIGAATGAVGGALLGNEMDSQDRRMDELEHRNQTQAQQIEENRRLIEELRKKGLDVEQSDRGVVVNLPDILFGFDKAQLTRRAEETVAEIAKVLRNHAGRRAISIEGHTDSIGGSSYNRDLSYRRARAVFKELRANGIDDSRMQVEGYGEGAPIATNNSEMGRARNRRVEVVIENQRYRVGGR